MSYTRVTLDQFGGPEVLEVVEEDILPEPGQNEVRIKVLATSAAFTDVIIRMGKYPNLREKPPFSPGYDMVGIVDKLGPGVTHLKIGQHVADLTVTGAYAEYICLLAAPLTPVPEDLDPAHAVSIVLSYVTAYQMLRRVAQVKKGQRILIHGAGGAVGTAMIQLGKLMGLEVYGTDAFPKHKLIGELGAIPVDYQSHDFFDQLKTMSGQGFAAIFDPIGGKSFKRSFSLLRPGGVLVAYGFYKATLGQGGSIPFDLLRLKLWDVLPNKRSTRFYSIGDLRKQHPDWFTEDLTYLFELLKRKEIMPIIAARMPLADARLAHTLIEQADVQGKIILTVGA